MGAKKYEGMKFINFLKIKHNKYLIGSLIILALVLISWAIYRYNTGSNVKRKHSSDSLSSLKRYATVKPSVAIRGFTFNGYREGKMNLSIRADSFIVDKKKIGFFRFGLISTAKLNNAIINIYCTDKNSYSFASFSESGYNNVNANVNAKTENVPKEIDIGNIFSPDIFKSIIKNRIATLEIAPVTINIHDNNGIISTINSGYSKISLKDGTVTFRKKVCVKAGDNILMTECLSLLPNRSIYRTNELFLLKTPQGESRGDNIEIDMRLDRIFSGDSYTVKPPQNRKL